MILGIEVLCEACGTKLEIPDVNTDHLLKVTLKARPCPKCNRPPDCHLSCEDVLELRRKLKTATDKVKELENKIKTLIALIPTCFGTKLNYSPYSSCFSCSNKRLCEIEVKKNKK